MRHDDARPRKRRRPPLRRKTVRWSAKEVDALLAGVRLHGVGKWAAILRHSPVFNGVRTSVDLKDKWRNLTSPVRAAALNNRDHSSKSTHPLVAQPTSADDLPDLNTAESSAPDLSKPESNQHHPDTDQTSDHNHLDPDPHIPEHSSAQPILDSHSAQEAPMSPIHSQEDAQQSLDDHTHQNSSHPKSHSNSDLSLLSPPSRDSNTLNPLRPDHSQAKSPPKLEPNLVHYPTRNSQIHPLHPPSESSVSPEVLSNPPQLPFQHNPHLILPQTHPQYPIPINHHIHPAQQTSSAQLSQSNLPSQQHVAAMYQFMNQSLYQSAAVLADYWRRIGHDPTTYGMPVPPGTPIPSHLYPYYAARMGSLYYSDDDDDDDDDYDHIAPILTPHADPYSLHLKKTPSVSDVRVPLFQPGLRDETARPSASRNPTESLNDDKARKKPRTEQITSESPGQGNNETKQTTTVAATSNVKQTSLASSGASASEAWSAVRKRTEGDTRRKSKESNGLPSSETGKKEKGEDRKNVLDSETVSPVSGIVTSTAVEVCRKPEGNQDLKPVPEQTEFDSVPDNVGYFPDDEFTAKSQQCSEKDKDENGERELTDQGAMGMAPLNFPGLGVEEQRQFPVTDLV